jgi:hypothetical protein
MNSCQTWYKANGDDSHENRHWIIIEHKFQPHKEYIKGDANNTLGCVINTPFPLFLSLECVHERKRERERDGRVC